MHAPSGMSVAPPSASAGQSRRISSSDSQSTKSENAGVNVKLCFTGLSMHMTVWPPIEKFAFITDPSAPGWPGP
jgi:hypothetical protein